MSGLPPRAAIECIDQALVLGRQNFWRLLRLGLIPLLFFYLVAHLLAGRLLGYWRIPANIGLYGIYGVIEALTTVGAWDVLHGTTIDVGAVWRRVTGRLGSVVVSTWLRLTILLFATIALVIPAIYLFAAYFAVPGINVLEDLGPWDSLVRSRKLALGSIGGILLSLGVFWLLGWIIAVAIPRGLLALEVRPRSPIYVVTAIVWAAIIIPFQGALIASVYLELRKRKEGYDLQHLMDLLPESPPPTIVPLGA